jgi:hypothetical protein
MDKTTFAFESFKNIQDLIKFVDQKSSAVLVVTGLIFTGYIQFIQGLTFSFTENLNFYGIMTFFTSMSTLLSLLMVVYISIFKVLKPRTAKHYAKDETSLFYYEHIAKVGKESILESYKTVNTDIMLKNIIDQQHEVSKILNEKTTELGKSFNWLFASIVTVVIFIIFSIQL